MKSNVKRWKRFKNDMTWYSFIIVSLLVLLIFTYLPTMATVYFSFTNMGTYGTEYKMVGLKNYTVLLESKSFLNAAGCLQSGEDSAGISAGLCNQQLGEDSQADLFPHHVLHSKHHNRRERHPGVPVCAPRKWRPFEQPAVEVSEA